MKSFYFNNLVYYIAGLASVIFVMSYFQPALFRIGGLVLLLLTIVVVIDALLVYGKKDGIAAERLTTDRFSIGDENKVVLSIRNNYSFPASLGVIDELPDQFQERNWRRKLKITGQSTDEIVYFLRPTTRGEYVFHDINVFVTAPLRLVKRKYVFSAEQAVKVYPSYIQMRRYHLLAVANRLQELGVRRMRQLGHSMEFEQIKEYVRGDDYRTINWKATARKEALMVNNYTDERSQQIYCMINKGRVMKMPFSGMTLLDHAINASLVLSNVALVRQDKAGLITFAENLDSFVQADKKPTQMNQVLETLYKQQTRFLEPDFEKLFSVIRTRITNRSLLVLFTNFESMESLERELPALRKIARYHLLLVVFFENTELQALTEQKVATLEDIYIKTIAEKFAFEKRLMVKELQKNGILSVLSSPENLTVNTINKYLELKTRMSI
ncbi:MAG: cell division protein FtsB [Sphingobacteriales bacterium 44-61]|nr:MAG: cell division protein FtsB [Sphingobacteriales bacterium 44-61]